MITNLATLRARIGASARGIKLPKIGLTCLGYTPDRVEPPVFYPGEIEMNRDAGGQRTFGDTRGYHVTATVLTSSADDRGGQEALDLLLSEGGDYDLIGAIESDRTLGGLCHTLTVESVDGYRLYTVGPTQFYGARFRILVIG